MICLSVFHREVCTHVRAAVWSRFSGTFLSPSITPSTSAPFPPDESVVSRNQPALHFIFGHSVSIQPALWLLPRNSCQLSPLVSGTRNPRERMSELLTTIHIMGNKSLPSQHCDDKPFRALRRSAGGRCMFFMFSSTTSGVAQAVHFRSNKTLAKGFGFRLCTKYNTFWQATVTFATTQGKGRDKIGMQSLEVKQGRNVIPIPSGDCTTQTKL